MLFNSLSYAVFLPIIFVLYWGGPHKVRWILLLISSYYFYMSWNPKYVVLIFFTTVISYLAALLIEKKEVGSKNRKAILILVSILCLGILFFFKYFNFVSETVYNVMGIFAIKMNPVTLNLILPVGISFYTFQTLSYVIDVYKGDIEAEHHLGKYATFISYFPQLVAGPIERSSNLLPQIKAEQKFSYEQATYGMKLMAWGFFKKMVIADSISQYTGQVYEMPQCFRGFSLVIVVFLFSFQIYCDFSGYSDIAIGTAKLMGINLMTNFKSPYFSQSIREFWSRWHISLSRNAFNFIVTFLASGLWHGANWTFVIWGGMHGIAQIIEKHFRTFRNSSSGFKWACKVVIIFVFCTVAWVFFAANSVSDAGYVLCHMLDGIGDPVTYLRDGFVNLGIGTIRMLILVFSLILLFVYDYVSLNNDCILLIGKKKPIVRMMIYLLFLCIIIFFKAPAPAEFVYFQF